MQIGLIKEKSCPICSAEIVEQSVDTGFDGKILVHCNGQRWERVKFACGLKLEWIPNYQQVETRGECRNDPMVISRKGAAQQLIVRLCEVIAAANDVSPTDREILRDAIAWRKF